MTGLLSWWVLHAPLFAASFCSICGALLIIRTLWRRKRQSLDEIGRRELTAHYAKLIETLPAFDPSTRTSISKKSWNRFKGYAKMGGAITAGSIIVIGVVSGFTGAHIENSTVEAKKSNPYFTVGCVLADKKKCTPDTYIRLLSVSADGYRYQFEHVSPSDGRPPWTMIRCPKSPKWPFDPGDVIIYFTYEERYSERCDALGQHWGWAGKRNADQLTDSEQAAQKSKGGAL